MPLVFLIGGARSGKSSLAVRLASDHGGSVTMIATGEALDDEMRERIAKHRAERPSGWRTVEEPVELLDALGSAPADDVVIVDCLSLWVANLLELGVDRVEERAHAAAQVAAARQRPTIAVSNEVGLGIVPPTPLGRSYRDILGRVNAIWADAAAEALLVVAGKTLRLTDV